MKKDLSLCMVDKFVEDVESDLNYDLGTGSVSGTDIFDISTTGMSYYDKFLPSNEQTSDERIGKIVYMTPQQYYEECAKNIFKNSSVKSLIQQRGVYDKDIIEYLEKVILQKKKKFPITVLDYSSKAQEGLHRMYTAGELFGWDDTKYPVLVVDWKDRELHAKTRKEKLIHKLDNLANIMSKFDSNYFDSMLDFQNELEEQAEELALNDISYKIYNNKLILSTSDVSNDYDLSKFKYNLKELQDIENALLDIDASESLSKTINREKNLKRSGRGLEESNDNKLNEIYPNKGESKKDFIARFMSATKDEYPDTKQRYAVALSYWKRRNEELLEGKRKKFNPKSYKTKEEVEKAIAEYEQKLSDDNAPSIVLASIEGILEKLHARYDELNESLDSSENELSKEQEEFFKDSKIRDESGNLLVCYHGTPIANIKEFKPNTFFTANKKYAQAYSKWEDEDTPNIYAVYLNITNPFDLSTKEQVEFLRNEFTDYIRTLNKDEKLLNSTIETINNLNIGDKVTFSNIADDLYDYLVNNKTSYDGLIVDEEIEYKINKGEYDESAKLSFVPLRPNQIKLVTNKKPTQSNDINS